MTAPYQAALMDGKFGEVGLGLPKDLTPEQKEVLKIMQQDLIKNKLKSMKEKLLVIEDKINQFAANGNQRKFEIYKSKLAGCLEEIQKLEDLLK